MNDLVSSVDGVPMVSSKKVADHFSKQHRQILDAIKRIIKNQPDFGRANFCASSYISEQGKSLGCFDMTRDGFSLVAMGLTGREAMGWKIKYINAFNEATESIYSIGDRVNRLEIERMEIKEAGCGWSALGREINKAKKAHVEKEAELMSEVQMRISFD